MPDNLKVGIVRYRRERKTDCVVHPSYRAHGVPHPYEMRLTLARKGLLEVARDNEIDVLLLNHSDRVGNQALIALGQQPDNVKHSAERTGCVCPSAEAEHVDPVARFKCLHEKLIRVRHVIGNTVTKREADDTRPPLADSSEGVPRAHRADARMVVSNLCLVAHLHLIKFHYVGLLFSKLIASTVAADHYIF